jgi:ribosomal protein S18 acetylase RimI-like enzyme
MSVSTTDTRIDPAQPSRLLKKKNIRQTYPLSRRSRDRPRPDCRRPPRTAPVPPVGGVAVRRFPADERRVGDLLATVGGTFSVAPGDDAVRRWCAVEEGGRVLACAADTSHAPGIGHMGSVAVHPDARRRGLGRAVVAWLTNDLLRQGCDAVVIGVFVSETAACRLYDRLGYTTEHEFLSGDLTVAGPAGPRRQEQRGGDRDRVR